jgi:hypothetical protein
MRSDMGYTVTELVAVKQFREINSKDGQWS